MLILVPFNIKKQKKNSFPQQKEPTPSHWARGRHRPGLRTRPIPPSIRHLEPHLSWARGSDCHLLHAEVVYPSGHCSLRWKRHGLDTGGGGLIWSRRKTDALDVIDLLDGEEEEPAESGRKNFLYQLVTGGCFLSLRAHTSFLGRAGKSVPCLVAPMKCQFRKPLSGFDLFWPNPPTGHQSN